jgi:transcriptional regulator of acetoin/glycerol metabolism
MQAARSEPEGIVLVVRGGPDEGPSASAAELVRRLQDEGYLVEVVEARAPGSAVTMEDAERAALEEALRRTQGNVSEAVRLLGIGRSTAYRMMKRYGMR